MKHRLRRCRRAAGDSLRWITYTQILSFRTCACLSQSEQTYRDRALTLVKKKNNVYFCVWTVFVHVFLSK